MAYATVAVGVTTISNEPWSNFTEADYPDAATYCRYSLIDLNEPGAEKTKELCKLPVFEPDGDLNTNAIAAAAARLAGAGGGVDAPPNKLRAAARKLIAFYRLAKMEAPDSVRRLAQ